MSVSVGLGVFLCYYISGTTRPNFINFVHCTYGRGRSLRTSALWITSHFPRIGPYGDM